MDRYKNISYRPFLFLLALFIVSGMSMSFAQDQVTELEEVEISATAIQKFGVGATISTIDTFIIENNKQNSLAQLIATQSSAYIKQYGAGMLASISFRGTGAGHTTFQWNGLQVGYPFLGQTDLSLIQMDFIDEVNLVHGSASARFGTGAIGGTVELKSNDPKEGISILVNQSMGFFGTSNSSIHFSKGGNHGYIKVGGFYKKSENNFPYKSSGGKKLGNQANADYSISGGHLSAKYVLNKNNSFDIQLQGTYANRNLQPSIGSTSNNNQIDNNFWSTIKYANIFSSGFSAIQYGFLYDNINYNGSITYSNQHKIDATYEYDFHPNISIELAANSTFVEVITPFYNSGTANEKRANLFSSMRWMAYNNLIFRLNLRQSFVTGYKIPFTPSIGFDFRAVNSTLWGFNVVGQFSKGYKVPTLNDRFWVPGGNLDLNPEESVNAEIGAVLKNKGNIPFWIKTTAYQLWVENWILWLPNGAIWSPENKRKVKGFGLEFESGIEKHISQEVQLKAWLNYAYTKSTNQEALDEYDRSAGKQLPYVPFHNGNITTQINTGNWDFQLNGVFTGKRFITADNETEVPGYAILNVITGYTFSLHTVKARAYINANNITNTNYQSIINKAMPGINFLAGVRINFNK